MNDLPRFDLSYDVDDRDVPSNVIVYSGPLDETGTHWITIDVDYAVDLADIA